MATSEHALSADSLAGRVRAARLPAPATRRRIREDAGVSLRMVADHLGVTPMTVLRWERGDASPRMNRAIAYKQLLDDLSEAVRA